MRALAIVHQRDAGPGVFAEAMRDGGVELEQWLRAESEEPPDDPGAYDAVLTFGGAMHVDHEAEHSWIAQEKALLAELLEADMPLLGVCLGSQLLAVAAGGAARRLSEPEIGWFEVEVTPEGTDDHLLGPLAPRFEAFEWHSYGVELPPGAVPLAQSKRCMQAYRIGASAWGIQFHAEVSAADVEGWIDDYRSDDDAVRLGLDADTLREQSRPKLGAWNELGRSLCDRFLAAAAARAA